MHILVYTQDDTSDAMMIHIPDELSSFWLMTISMGLIQCYEIKVMDACDVS